MPKRVNKSKKDIVSNIQLVQDADRRRALIKDVIFPYVVSMGDNIGYSKIFLQAMSGLIEGEMEKRRKTTTVGHIKDGLLKKAQEIFTLSDPEQKKEYERYVGLIEKLEDISVQDFTYAAELPRYIDGYLTKSKDKESFSSIDIDSILG